MTPDLDLKAAREAVARRFEDVASRFSQGGTARAETLQLAADVRAGKEMLGPVENCLSAIRIRREMEAING